MCLGRNKIGEVVEVYSHDSPTSCVFFLIWSILWHRFQKIWFSTAILKLHTYHYCTPSTKTFLFVHADNSSCTKNLIACACKYIRMHKISHDCACRYFYMHKRVIICACRNICMHNRAIFCACRYICMHKWLDFLCMKNYLHAQIRTFS